MLTGLNYTDRFQLPVEIRAYKGREPVIGMPYRPFYEADKGWEDLMLAYVPGDGLRRQGAVATEQAPKEPRHPHRGPNEQRQERDDQL